MTPHVRFALFRPPYRILEPVQGEGGVRYPRARAGVALVWRPEGGAEGQEIAAARPPAVRLLALLPPARSVADDPGMLHVLARCHPWSVIPHHPAVEPGLLREALRRPPDDFAGDVTDHLVWRGMRLETATRRLVLKIFEMSAEIRTVAALARGLYQSRRALGRHMLSSGLPVPSHWLHFARVLRAAVRLQSTDDTVFDVAVRLGYPDGFALSNQMARLAGVRPSAVRRNLGWEWIVEAWLEREAREGSLAPHHSRVAAPTRDANGRTSPARGPVVRARTRPDGKERTSSA